MKDCNATVQPEYSRCGCRPALVMELVIAGELLFDYLSSFVLLFLLLQFCATLTELVKVNLKIDAVPVYVTREHGPAFTECLSPGTADAARGSDVAQFWLPVSRRSFRDLCRRRFVQPGFLHVRVQV